MKVNIDGRTLVAKNMDTAPIRHVAELQRQTGWKLEELRDNVQKIDIYAAAVLLFLTLHNAGFTPTWDDVLDRDLSELEIIQEPGDERRIAEAEGSEDPQNSPQASVEDADDPAAAE